MFENISNSARKRNKIRSSLLLISLKENKHFMKNYMKINSRSSEQYAKQYDSENIILIQTFNGSSSYGSSIHKKQTSNRLSIPTALTIQKGLTSISSSLSLTKELRKKKIGKEKLRYSNGLLFNDTFCNDNKIENGSLIDKSFESSVSALSYINANKDEKTARAKEGRFYLKNLILSFKYPKLKLRTQTNMCLRLISPERITEPSPARISFDIPLMRNHTNTTQIPNKDFLSSASAYTSEI